MTKQPKTSVRDRLLNTGATDTTSKPLPELASQTLIISISDIAEYERNPRVYPNPEHESIKESIRSRGLLQQLVVTQKPGTEKYVLLQGGNTRLKCLRELHEETGDLKFAQVLCEFRPWTTEDDLLIGHYIENEQRGNLNWYEKSALVCNLQSMFEARTGGLPLPSTDFERQASAAGIKIRRNELHLYRYTVDRLGNRLAQRYQQSIGKRTIEKLRKLDLAAKSIWEDAGLDSEKFDDVFFTLLSDYDSHADLDALVKNTNLAVGDRVHDLNFNKMQAMMMSHVFDNRHAPHFEDLYLAPLKGTKPEWQNRRSDQSPTGIGHPEASATDSQIESTGTSDSSSADPSIPRKPGRLAQLRTFQKRTISARNKVFKAANNFADLTGNTGCLANLRFGYGFMVFNFPQSAPDLPKEFLRHRDQAWWLLVELSQWRTAWQHESKRLARAAAAEKSNMQRCFSSTNDDPLTTLLTAARDHGMTMPAPASNITALFTHISRPAFRNFQRLITHYQEIDQINHDFDIWKPEKKYE